MGKRLRTFDFTDNVRREYPWDDWCDGSIWLILQEEDFSVTLKSMQAQLYIRAKAIGARVKTRFQQDPPGIIFQFDYPNGGAPEKRAGRKRKTPGSASGSGSSEP